MIFRCASLGTKEIRTMFRRYDHQFLKTVTGSVTRSSYSKTTSPLSELILPPLIAFAFIVPTICDGGRRARCLDESVGSHLDQGSAGMRLGSWGRRGGLRGRGHRRRRPLVLVSGGGTYQRDPPRQRHPPPPLKAKYTRPSTHPMMARTAPSLLLPCMSFMLLMLLTPVDLLMQTTDGVLRNISTLTSLTTHPSCPHIPTPPPSSSASPSPPSSAAGQRRAIRCLSASG